MADDTIVRWEGSGPSGCLLPPSILPFGVLLALALNRFFSVPWFPHGLIILGSISVIGVVLWPVNDRNEVTAAEFTPLQMRLASRAAEGGGLDRGDGGSFGLHR
ncbi:hypothetical protein [Nonomuraea sp. NPDC050786]|uniref:hypothetical protein n=1 Tax=Nonomuraea sp. NPDC050786 TaxID=3154840 RepID=UPI0033CB25C8